MFAQQRLTFTNTDPVFAGARAADREREIDHTPIDGPRARPGVSVLGRQHEENVEIAVANMAENGCDKVCRGDRSVRPRDRLSEPRDRYADVRRPNDSPLR